MDLAYRRAADVSREWKAAAWADQRAAQLQAEHLSPPGIEFLTISAESKGLSDKPDNALCAFIINDNEQLSLELLK